MTRVRIRIYKSNGVFQYYWKNPVDFGCMWYLETVTYRNPNEMLRDIQAAVLRGLKPDMFKPSHKVTEFYIDKQYNDTRNKRSKSH